MTAYAILNAVVNSWKRDCAKMVSAPLYCNACGAANQPGAPACSVCGQSLQSAQAAEPDDASEAAQAAELDDTSELAPGVFLQQRYRILSRLGRGQVPAIGGRRFFRCRTGVHLGSVELLRRRAALVRARPRFAGCLLPWR